MVYRRMWRVVPCASKKSLRTDSWKDIEEILKSKLATINEEPENCEEGQGSPTQLLKRLSGSKRGKKKKKNGTVSSSSSSSSNKESNKVLRNFVLPQFSIKDSYALFMTRFASKGSFGGLLQY